MKKSKQKALEKKGWKIGDTQEILNLSNEEMEYIESKIALANKLRAYREKKGLSQVHLANIVNFTLVFFILCLFNSISKLNGFLKHVMNFNHG